MIFGDFKRVFRIDYLQKGNTITGQYHAQVLTHFDAQFKKNNHIL